MGVIPYSGWHSHISLFSEKACTEIGLGTDHTFLWFRLPAIPLTWTGLKQIHVRAEFGPLMSAIWIRIQYAVKPSIYEDWAVNVKRRGLNHILIVNEWWHPFIQTKELMSTGRTAWGSIALGEQRHLVCCSICGKSADRSSKKHSLAKEGHLDLPCG